MRFVIAALAAGIATHASSVEPTRGDVTLERVNRIVLDSFYSPSRLKRLGWAKLVEQTRERIARAPSKREDALRDLVAALHTSHTEYIPRSDPKYWELASVLEPLFPEVPDQCPDKATTPPIPVTWDDIGVLWKRDGDGRWFLSGVFVDGPAQRAGLVAGDEIVSADGAPFSPVSSFAGKAGSVVSIKYRRTLGGPVAVAQVSPRRIQPQTAFREALRSSAVIIEREQRRIAYLRIWSWAGEAMQGQLLDVIGELNRKRPDAFVVDIRDGWGGAQPRYITVFDSQVPVLESKDRSSGEVYRLDTQIRAPAVVLINGGTRSGKEVIAYGIKKHRRGTLVGEKTAGAMLPGSPFCLPDGALLYLAIADNTVDGKSLEGNGVEPDVVVPLDVRYSAGRDSQIDEALRLMSMGPVRE